MNVGKQKGHSNSVMKENVNLTIIKPFHTEASLSDIAVRSKLNEVINWWFVTTLDVYICIFLNLLIR